MPEVAAAQVLILLRQGNLAAAAHLAQTHDLPLSQARVHLAQGDTSAALAVLEAIARQMEAKGWQDERLKVMVLQAVALHAHGEKDKAVQVLCDALALAEPGGFIRLFVDEGPPMAHLLSASSGSRDDARLYREIAGCIGSGCAEARKHIFSAPTCPAPDRAIQPTRVGSPPPHGARTLESGDCERLFLALSTVKGHNRNIFGKLQVQRRTEAVARARELGLL